MERLRQLFATEAGWNQTILRLMAGVVMFPHGAQKLLGWFGGHGFSGTMGFFTERIGLPWILAFGVVMIEFFGSLGLLAGAFTRLAAIGVAMIMAGAVTVVHWKNGFFMNWSGSLGGEGFEFHLLMIAICLALVIAGGGRASVDALIAQRLKGGAAG